MLKQTALIEEHKKLGGRLIDFGSWELPVQYTSVIEEHIACRTAAAIFDVSHMGEVLVAGLDAQEYLNFLITNDVTRIQNNQALYTVMCLETGGIVDDLIIYKFSPEKFLVVVNASNTEKDFDHMKKILNTFKTGQSNCTIQNVSTKFTQLALQGSKALDILKKLTPVDVTQIKPFFFVEGLLNNGTKALIARTGYTGEDGVEIYLPWEKGPALWNEILEAGKPFGLKPCGLAARDTLRLEMKYPLYGNELTENTNPLEAGLEWVVKFQKHTFVGKDSLIKIKSEGLKKKLIGLKLTDRGIPRHGYKIFSLGDPKKEIGVVTSGTQSPSLKASIAIAYLNTEYCEIGGKVLIDIRGNFANAEVVPTPFYRRL